MGEKLIARSTPMEAAEVRMGIVPVDGLLDQRRVLVDKVADMRARFGPFGTAEQLRKIELARIKEMCRLQAKKDGRGVSEARIDDLAHAHPQYEELLNAMTIKRAEWIKLENLIEEIDALIMRGQAVAKFVSGETFLQRGGT